MKVAVIDCTDSGHRETYYKQFARTWASMGHEVFLLAPDGTGIDRSVSFSRSAFRPLLPQPAGHSIQKKIAVMHNALIRLQNLATLKRQLKERQPDIVCFPCLDDMLPTLSPRWLLDKLLPYKWCGLFVQSAQLAHKPGRPDIRPALRSRNCMGIGVLNEYSIEALHPFCRKVVPFPDFADLSVPDPSYPLLNTLRKQAAGRKIISLLGSVSTRKGIELLLRTIPSLPEKEYFFLIAGKSSLSKEETERMQAFRRSHSNCLFELKKIPDEASFNALVEESSLIFAAYHQFSGSSNLLTKAAAFGKPVIVSKGYCMEKRVRKYETGTVIPEDDVEACRTAILQRCNQGITSTNGFAQYVTDHSIEKLTKCFYQIVHKKP